MISYKARLANISDAEEISRLSCELEYGATVNDIINTLNIMLNDSKYYIAVIQDNNTLLGWIAVERRLWLESGEGIEITGLIVSASARRKRIGYSLVMAAEQWARELGFNFIRVRSNTNREEAHHFYQRIGFELNKTQYSYKKILL